MCGIIKYILQGVGVTTTLPDEVPSFLAGSESQSHEWNYFFTSLWHNGMEVHHNLPSLTTLNKNQKVGILLSASGNLHVYVDGKHVEMVATKLPVNQPLWGAVDMRGTCIAISSEMLCGKLCGLLCHVQCGTEL